MWRFGAAITFDLILFLLFFVALLKILFYKIKQLFHFLVNHKFLRYFGEKNNQFRLSHGLLNIYEPRGWSLSLHGLPVVSSTNSWFVSGKSKSEKDDVSDEDEEPEEEEEESELPVEPEEALDEPGWTTGASLSSSGAASHAYSGFEKF